MSIMIPEKPNNFSPGSLEDVMFMSLEKLPDEYTVFHSFRITKIKSNVVYESETDFIIVHQRKGVLCLEAKAGAVTYRSGQWWYGNGEPMRNGGPFNQAAANKWKLMKLIGDSKWCELIDRIKFLHGVWFPSLTDAEIDSISMPPEGDRQITIGMEALANPRPYIDALFSLDVRAGVVTNITEKEIQGLIKDVLCPEVNVFPTIGFDKKLKHIVFHRMLDEQAGILNFLTEQRSAAINGAAGTGKTLVAVEKARRNASNGQKVLFLCYNVELKKYLSMQFANELIDYMTIDGYVCRLCGTDVADYVRAKEKLKDYIAFENFPYKHVIVDEGQDFGREMIDESEVLQMLYDAVMAPNDIISSFYVFYDKLQMVQADRFPVFIEKADCRLTLYRNCRNTGNVSKTSRSLLPETPRDLVLHGLAGKIPRLHFSPHMDCQKEVLDNVIDNLLSSEIDNIVILTLETEQSSFLTKYVNNGTYRGYRFTSCRKFKGLEADAIILVDFSGKTVLQNKLLFYVGASRARIRLEIVTSLNNEECRVIIEKLTGVLNPRRPMRDLASVLHCTAELHKIQTKSV